MNPHFHIIDPDSLRRAQLAREIVVRNLHAEIYESMEEFSASTPSPGFILAHQEELLGLSLVETGEAAALPIVVYADEPSTEDVVKAMHAGAIDYFEWPAPEWQLDSMLRRIEQFGREKARLMRRSAEARGRVERLSRREHEVLVELVKGKSTKEMGLVLGISPRTVEIHRGNMMRKLQAGSAARAVQIGLLAGLDDDFRPFAADVAVEAA